MNENIKIQEAILRKITDSLKNVVGVEAIVFGGSRTIGTNSNSSNIDIGIYYLANGVLDVQTMSQSLTELDDAKRQGLLALPGTWGEWLNGGACLTIDGVLVDFYLRDISKVVNILDTTNNKGMISVSYQYGHPFGFISSMYLAETDTCIILFEKKKAISNLKQKVRPMSIIYKKACIEYFLWEASYSAMTGRRCIDKKDVIYAMGALYKAANSLAQVVYTINEEYVLNEKGSFNKINTFKNVPKDFVKNIESIFLSLDYTNMENAFQIIDYYVEELKSMVQALNIYTY